MNTELQGEGLLQTIHYYLETYCVEESQVSKTIRNKTQLLNRLHVFLKGSELTVDTCKLFQQSLTTWKAPNSRKDLARVLRSFVNFYYKKYRKELLLQNWAEDIPSPTIKREPLELVNEKLAEEIIIAGTTPSRGDRSRSKKIKVDTRLALMWMLRTGDRVDEVYQMKGSDIFLNADVPYVRIHSKGGHIDRQVIPADFLNILESRIQYNRVFVFTPKTANKLLADGSRKLGIANINTSCHDLRHIFALTRLRSGVPLQLVSRALRHTSIATTDKYYSNYVLSDIATVVNNSQIIQQKVTSEGLMEIFMRLVKQAGLDDDRRFELKTLMNNTGLHLDILFKK